MCASHATLVDMPIHTPMSERIPRFTDLDPETGCLLWRTRPHLKYVQVSWHGRSALAHRLVWEETHGPIPEGMTIEHTCGRGRCMNVDHMTLLTRGDNVRAYYAKQETCKRGHAYTGTNRQGWRVCNPCKAAEARRRRARSIT
jgi:hypothetical protein